MNIQLERTENEASTGQSKVLCCHLPTGTGEAIKNLLGLFVFLRRMKTSTSGTQEALLFQATCLVCLPVGSIIY